MLKLFFINLLCIVLWAHALPVHGVKTLLLYDSKITDLNEYSKLFATLQKRSYKIEFVAIDDSNDQFKLYDGEKRLYDNLILFPTKSRTISSNFDVSTLLNFSEDGGDVLTITSPGGLNDAVRIYLNQLGIYPSPRDSKLVDYFQKGASDVISISTSEVLNRNVFSEPSMELVYSGSSALLGNGELLVPILAAPRTSFNTNNKGDRWTVGSQGYLIAGFQSLNNARTVWIGSDSFLKDDVFNSNGLFIEDLIKWNFREKAVIKSVGFSHSHSNGISYDEHPYKVRDSIVYEVGFSEWNGSDWVPFITDDVQFELRMIDPYYRLTLNASRQTKDIQYYTTGEFKLPDHHGVFTFLTDYRRSGLSYVTEKDVKAIRHLANDEYPRSYKITNAWVYLSSIFSVIFLFSMFLLVYMNAPITENVGVEKKNN
ncbi:dolichyl-diphosphooligosaccharide-protein glycotransferase Ecym_4488 [Eremothecium cymbalariae DBVPG|uniref:Dolichyl-diphosphooligosaccharide--protein glycosyltransferase subunit WBP1 n=1 Tax=Eremothecium cymbalariae (strain CBS 270.75 / DBVPG 7215 / KCTC 17166 / NRRL Y-17582) TaxID=931890 RepID=G8JU24_ERECY|nr:hypothetical protein Ecym_4488 [Eremothecium cymbalariae DBVPG\